MEAQMIRNFLQWAIAGPSPSFSPFYSEAKGILRAESTCQPGFVDQPMSESAE
jgi:hypothetical protein